MILKPVSLNANSPANSRPYIAKKTWLLTLDDPDASKRETFFAVQVSFTGAISATVCIATPFQDGSINPIFVPYSGAIIPVEGQGFLSSGNDSYGNAIVTTAGVFVIAFGSDKVLDSFK